MAELQQQGFKLIAIQPRWGCHPDFRKVLKEGEIYSFYPSYQFIKDNKAEVIRIDPPKSEPRLYDLNGLAINISAVVGKNGSGKSTLTELLYYAIYFLSTSLPQHGDSDKTVLLPNYLRLQNDLNELWTERMRILKKIREHRKSRKSLYNKDSSWLNRKKYVHLTREIQREMGWVEDLNTRIRKCRKEILDEKVAHQFILDHLKLSIFYLLGGVFYELKIDNREDVSRNISISMLLSTEKRALPFDSAEVVLKHFFYTVAINYSHYALNSLQIGKWINALFHKNDAYFSPASINPMRTEGDFNINRERSLALYRLLLYIILEYRQTKKEVLLTDHQQVHAVRFTLNPLKTEKVPLRITSQGFSGSREYASALRDIQSTFFRDWSYHEAELFQSEVPFKEELFRYLAKKWLQIRETYGSYGEEWNVDRLAKLNDENTHVTFKLKQAVNYLKQCIRENSKAAIWTNASIDKSGQLFFDISLETLNQWIPDNIQDPVEIMNHLPPPIFDIDFLFKPIESNDKTNESEISNFSALSSGEQQLIHSIQSTLYHLNNIQSAHRNEDGRQTYNAVNIIYDEIELYFHPEYQRQFIHRFLQSLERLRLGPGNGIKNVNILFSTHSPFVLSDIPSSNILRLSAGRLKLTKETDPAFGANLYTLLKDSFFLKAYIGEHARKEIQKLINTLKTESEENRPDQFDGEVLSDSPEQLKNRIELIGEPFLRDKLFEMYYMKFDREKRINELELELQRLKKEGI